MFALYKSDQLSSSKSNSTLPVHQSLKLHRNETSCKLETFNLHAYNSIYRYYHGHIMLTCLYHQRHHNISFENSYFYSQKICSILHTSSVFRYLISDCGLLTSYTTIRLLKTVAFSFGILYLFKNMILSTMSLDNLFLSLLISRPTAEKMHIDRTDVARMRLAMIHYENPPMQYTAIFHGCKNLNFQMKFFNIFLIFAQNIDCGYTLEPPQ